MVLDATLLNTQHYKVRIKGKVEQYLGVVAIEKEAVGSPSNKIANLTNIFLFSLSLFRIIFTLSASRARQ